MNRLGLLMLWLLPMTTATATTIDISSRHNSDHFDKTALTEYIVASENVLLCSSSSSYFGSTSTRVARMKLVGVTESTIPMVLAAAFPTVCGDTADTISSTRSFGVTGFYFAPIEPYCDPDCQPSLDIVVYGNDDDDDDDTRSIESSVTALFHHLLQVLPNLSPVRSHVVVYTRRTNHVLSWEIALWIIGVCLCVSLLGLYVWYPKASSTTSDEDDDLTKRKNRHDTATTTRMSWEDDDGTQTVSTRSTLYHHHHHDLSSIYLIGDHRDDETTSTSTSF